MSHPEVATPEHVTQQFNQDVIDRILLMAQFVLFHKPTQLEHILPDGQILQIRDPHGVYAQAKLVIDLIAKLPLTSGPNSTELQRIASYAFYDQTVTNHPEPFAGQAKDHYLPVTNAELESLLDKLCQLVV